MSFNCLENILDGICWLKIQELEITCYKNKTLYLGFENRSTYIFHFLFFIKSLFGMCRMLRTKCWTWNTCQLVNRITTLAYMETKCWSNFSLVSLIFRKFRIARKLRIIVREIVQNSLQHSSKVICCWIPKTIEKLYWCCWVVMSWISVTSNSWLGTPETFSSKLSPVFCCLWFMALTRANLGLKDLYHVKRHFSEL